MRTEYQVTLLGRPETPTTPTNPAGRQPTDAPAPDAQIPGSPMPATQPIGTRIAETQIPETQPAEGRYTEGGHTEGRRLRRRPLRRHRFPEQTLRPVTAPGPVRRPAPTTVPLPAAEPAPAGPGTPATVGDRPVRRALDRARDHLAALQSPAGWWKGELETNVTIEAEDLLMRHVLGLPLVPHAEATARWIRSRQRADGTWATFHGGPGDLSTTVEAYLALRLAGDPVDAEPLRRARAWIAGQGGTRKTRVFTRVWLAMCGLHPWDELPALPPEMVLLPTWAPLNVYSWGCWARQTVVPLSIVLTLRPTRPLELQPGELPGAGDTAHTGGPGTRTAVRPGGARWTAAGLMTYGADRALRAWARRPVSTVRRHALARAESWIISRQEADGSWGGIQPPWVYSLIALRASGYPLDHPVIAAGLAGLERFTVTEQGPDGPVRRLEACQSPVWDTVLAMIALGESGSVAQAPGQTPALERAREWVLDEEVTRYGDWAVRRPGLAAGGWAFEFDNDGYPDVDDTAEVLLALRVVGDTPRGDAARERAITWLLGMQSRDGGWGAFDADNTSRLCSRLQFSDFGAVTDPPTADVTAHVVEALAAEGLAAHPAVRRGVDWLLANQEPAGSWFGRWGANHVYGTGAAVPALVAAGVAPTAPPVRRAVDWLGRVQNADGGWGEDLRSYRDSAWIGRGTSTASQTAWALLALLAAGEPGGPGTPLRGGVDYLMATQRADGTWDEPQFTGTGFPGDFYVNYHLYRLIFPITALARALEIVGDQ